MVSAYVLVSLEPGRNEEVLEALREFVGGAAGPRVPAQPDIFAFIEVANEKTLEH